MSMMQQKKAVVATYLLRLTERDLDNRRTLERSSAKDFSDILRAMMEEAAERERNSAFQVLEPEESELRKFVMWLNDKSIMSAKTITPAAIKAWKARRKTYTARELAEAFVNLCNEPDRWQLRNNGFRPLSWWLEKDDRIETMRNCHLKAPGKGTPIPQL